MGKQGFRKATPTSNFYKSNLGNTTKLPFSKPNPLDVLKQRTPTSAAKKRPERNPKPKERDRKNRRSRKPKSAKTNVIELPLTTKSSETNRFTPPNAQGKPVIRPIPVVKPRVSFNQTANYGSNDPYQLEETPIPRPVPPKLPAAALKSGAKLNLLFDTTKQGGEDKLDLAKNMKLRVLMGIHLDKHYIRSHEVEAAQTAQNELIKLKLGVKGDRFKLTPLGQFIGETLEHLGNATLHSIKLDKSDAHTQVLIEQGLVKKGHVEIDIKKEHLFKTPHLMQLLREENINLAHHPDRIQLKLPRLVFTKDGARLHALLSVLSLRNRAGTVTPPPVNEAKPKEPNRPISQLSDSLANNLERNSGFRRQWGVSTAQLPTVVEDLKRIARGDELPKYQRPKRETMMLPVIPLDITKKERTTIWGRIANAAKAGLKEFRRK